MELTNLSTRPADPIQLLKVLSVDNVEGAVRQIPDIKARLLRIFGKCRCNRCTACGVRRDIDVLYKTADAGLSFRVGALPADFADIENLNAVITTITGVEQSIRTDDRAMQGTAEEHGFQITRLKVASPWPSVIGVNIRAFWIVHGVLPVGAEVTYILAILGVHDQNAPVSVAVGDVHPIGRWFDAEVSDQVGLWCAVGAAVYVLAIRAFHPRVADLIDELALGGEFQDM